MEQFEDGTVINIEISGKRFSQFLTHYSNCNFDNWDSRITYGVLINLPTGLHVENFERVDDFNARFTIRQLHRGERVLTAEENRMNAVVPRSARANQHPKRAYNQ